VRAVSKYYQERRRARSPLDHTTNDPPIKSHIEIEPPVEREVDLSIACFTRPSGG